MVEPLSRDFLLSRGYCCNNGCKNCPYIKCSKCENTFTCEVQIGKDKCWCMDYEPINISGDKCMCSECMNKVSKLDN